MYLLTKRIYFLYFSYEVGIGTGPGKSDLADYKSVGLGNSVFLDKLPLIPGTQVHKLHLVEMFHDDTVLCPQFH